MNADTEKGNAGGAAQTRHAEHSCPSDFPGGGRVGWIEAKNRLQCRQGTYKGEKGCRNEKGRRKREGAADREGAGHRAQGNRNGEDEPHRSQERKGEGKAAGVRIGNPFFFRGVLRSGRRHSVERERENGGCHDGQQSYDVRPNPLPIGGLQVTVLLAQVVHEIPCHQGGQDKRGDDADDQIPCAWQVPVAMHIGMASEPFQAVEPAENEAFEETHAGDAPRSVDEGVYDAQPIQPSAGDEEKAETEPNE